MNMLLFFNYNAIVFICFELPMRLPALNLHHFSLQLFCIILHLMHLFSSVKMKNKSFVSWDINGQILPMFPFPAEVWLGLCEHWRGVDSIFLHSSEVCGYNPFEDLKCSPWTPFHVDYLLTYFTSFAFCLRNLKHF